MKKRISDLLNNPIVPFDIEDARLVKLFSFFLHSAPRINSNRAIQIDDARLDRNWNAFIKRFDKSVYKFMEASSPKLVMDYFQITGISDSSELRRRGSRFVCRKKDKYELESVCLLRHIRNAIAHGNVHLLNAGNRKFVLFEDFNEKGKQTARILFSQTDLQSLKSEILK